MNVMPCREVEFLNPFQFKDRTRERGKVWDDVVSKLQEHGLDVSRRSVRDRYNLINNNIKRRNNLEKRQSGIAPEMSEAETEMTQIVEGMVEIKAETKEQESEEEKKKLDGGEIRKLALESFTETSKRSFGDLFRVLRYKFFLSGG